MSNGRFRPYGLAGLGDATSDRAALRTALLGVSGGILTADQESALNNWTAQITAGTDSVASILSVIQNAVQINRAQVVAYYEQYLARYPDGYGIDTSLPDSFLSRLDRGELTLEQVRNAIATSPEASLPATLARIAERTTPLVSTPSTLPPTTTTTPSTSTPAPSSSLSDFFTKSVQLFGVDVPMWALLAVGAYFVFSGDSGGSKKGGGLFG